MIQKLSLFRRIQEVLDSPYRDEFIIRFRKMYKVYQTSEWKETETALIERGFEDDIEAQRTISIKPLDDEISIDEKEYDETRKAIKVFGPFSFEFKENIELKKKQDYINELLDDIRDADAFYLVIYAEAPERIVKKFIYDKVAKPLIYHLELQVGKTIDNITGREEFGLSTSIHTDDDIDISKGKKFRRDESIRKNIAILNKRLRSKKVLNDPHLREKTQNELDKLQKTHINWRKMFDVFIKNPVKTLLEW